MLPQYRSHKMCVQSYRSECLCLLMFELYDISSTHLHKVYMNVIVAQAQYSVLTEILKPVVY